MPYGKEMDLAYCSSQGPHGARLVPVIHDISSYNIKFPRNC